MINGSDTHDPTKFNWPSRLCFMDDDTMLVCDMPDNCVQRLTHTGELVSSVHAERPVSIATYGDMVAVSTESGTIEIHLLSSSVPMLNHRFGMRGEGPGQFDTCAIIVRFTPDGSRLLAVDRSMRRLFLRLFTVDGVFIRCTTVGSDICTGISKDVACGTGGEIIVADCDSHRICVLSPNCKSRLKAWGSEGTDPAQFEYPRAFAISGPYLYVLDSTRVQVFE